MVPKILDRNRAGHCRLPIFGIPTNRIGFQSASVTVTVNDGVDYGLGIGAKEGSGAARRETAAACCYRDQKTPSWDRVWTRQEREREKMGREENRERRRRRERNKKRKKERSQRRKICCMIEKEKEEEMD